ncbi:ROK family protein [Rhodoferax sp. WC2427]|uniref:ROK family transcriptional regulator n=1 Tax=Rhodoferax sp. WC2427 TaxID=3234144 RepID=UPI003465F03D
MKTTGDQQLVKRINRSVLLRLLRAQPGLSRARLATESGLTKSTVSLLVRELLDDGWLTEAMETVNEGLGRPSTPLRIHEGKRALIGVEIAVGVLRVACVSLQGEILHADEQPLASTDPALASGQTARMVATAYAELVAVGLELVGVGVCTPGAIDHASGLVLFAPNLGWRNLDLLGHLTRALAEVGLPPVPLQLQNDADAGALGEYEFADGEGEDPLIFVSCDAGVGAGIVSNDRLFSGAQGMAGEIGHTIMQIDGPLCSCGRRGCAEAFIGLRALSGQDGKAVDLGRSGHYLGVLLQNLWTTFNPRAIVVGGQSCDHHPEFLQSALATVATYAASSGMPAPSIRMARYGPLAAVVGAAALTLHEYLRPMHPNSEARRARAGNVGG